jgi:hypothetical protein
MGTPLRAVILDNDETTGSYHLLIAILTILQEASNVTFIASTQLLERLANWMMVHGCFRPGLRNFLSTLTSLREEGLLDAVVMYTNQRDFDIPATQTIAKLVQSPARCVAYMLEYLVQKPIFDRILTRPENAVLQNGTYTKDFLRVLQQYPDRPKDIRMMRFIDDLAFKMFIHASQIPKNKQDEVCWHPWPRHVRTLKEVEVFDCVKTIFPGHPHQDILFEMICIEYNKYPVQMGPTSSANIVLESTQMLFKTYGYVRKLSNQTRKPVLLELRTVGDEQRGSVQQDANRRNASQASGGASEGKYVLASANT